ncbi:hypothetical protein GGX14DRAFT_553911 [Mycena pura]|uniref:Uncharacterized protein n=1 Tax=Mycena pura TaxID=153505 RepID=A0AAD6YW39_9AGAR|nr:hypothetical protein GGX14DRAFT_553911 [Mycena pura]
MAADHSDQSHTVTWCPKAVSPLPCALPPPPPPCTCSLHPQAPTAHVPLAPHPHHRHHHPKAPRIGRAPQLLASALRDVQRVLPLARGAADGRFLSLATLLPRLVVLRHPSKAVIVNSSIATVHVARCHRVLTAQTPRVLDRKAEALQMVSILYSPLSSVRLFHLRYL